VNRREWIDYCLTLPDVYEDYPFDDPKDPHAWAVMRHTGNRKSFALIYERNGLCLNLKCDPLRADFLRGYYKGVTPGYHMNKRHWNTVQLNADVPDEEVRDLIAHSYELTRPNKPRK
jgi:predicted DNA-binding protein (MmcQ/YjbR family)